MYSTRSGLIFGFHGCDQSLLNRIFSGEDVLEQSKNSYDWLGNGIYFWENSEARALEYAESLRDHPQRAKKTIKNPAVIGAVLDLGFCLDLLDYGNMKLLKMGYDLLISTTEAAKLPINKTISGSNDLLLRDLDCAVIETLHKTREDNNLQPFDSVKAVFPEGDEPYANAGFRMKNHIQICIRNPNCIKGFFLPRKLNVGYPKV